jgi:hypothetical protein
MSLLRQILNSLPKKRNKIQQPKRPKIDYAQLEWALVAMNKDWKLYKMIKAEMQHRGHWKNQRRGRPFQKGYDSRQAK